MSNNPTYFYNFSITSSFSFISFERWSTSSFPDYWVKLSFLSFLLASTKPYRRPFKSLIWSHFFASSTLRTRILVSFSTRDATSATYFYYIKRSCNSSTFPIRLAVGPPSPCLTIDCSFSSWSLYNANIWLVSIFCFYS